MTYIRLMKGELFKTYFNEQLANLPSWSRGKLPRNGALPGEDSTFEVLPKAIVK